jgi:hypothetical protein
VSRLLHWLEDKSDWLSPLVVKEVRQIVRGREFYYSFGASLVAGLAVAFFGAADALSGSASAGSWTFFTLMGCLGVVGLAVVPLGAFSALRTERTEQTLDLISVTALSPRRVIVGKLLAQGVKLATLFAAVAPFITMCFLLGGIDLVTVLISLLQLFLWSLWACAGCLFLSTLFKSRAMSGLIFGAAGVLVMMALVASRPLFLAMSRGVFGATPPGATATLWLALAMAMSACIVTMINLVLLAENRLSLPTEDRTSALRFGFLVQFLAIVAWTLSFINEAPRVRSNAVEALGFLAGVHLAIVAIFTFTEDLIVSRRVLIRLHSGGAWRWLLAIFRPGGGRGAAYVLVQMGLLLWAAWLFQPDWTQVRWLLAICGYICFFAAVPVTLFRFVRPAAAAAVKLRVALLVLVAISGVLPDVVHYVLWQPEVLDLEFSARHLVNPFRTLSNWRNVETLGWQLIPALMGFTGVIAAVALIRIGRRMTGELAALEPHRSAASAGEPGRADLY